jgi:hypothetical protein
MTKINLLKPKYSGKYCGDNEYQYRAEIIGYLWWKLMERYNGQNGILVDITSTVDIDIKPGLGFARLP